jgi:hypothetical protein
MAAASSAVGDRPPAAVAASATAPVAVAPGAAPPASEAGASPPPVVHVTASSKAPATPAPKSTCTPGWIDECGSCYQRCEVDRDCKAKGLTCQPIVCAHGSYGNGCAPP